MLPPLALTATKEIQLFQANDYTSQRLFCIIIENPFGDSNRQKHKEYEGVT